MTREFLRLFNNETLQRTGVGEAEATAEVEAGQAHGDGQSCDSVILDVAHARRAANPAATASTVDEKHARSRLVRSCELCHPRLHDSYLKLRKSGRAAAMVATPGSLTMGQPPMSSERKPLSVATELMPAFDTCRTRNVPSRVERAEGWCPSC